MLKIIKIFYSVFLLRFLEHINTDPIVVANIEMSEPDKFLIIYIL